MHAVPLEPRVVCLRCRRPANVCYCPHLPHLPTRTRVVVLQHPRERDTPIGTGRMATLCLPNAELYVGVDWGASAALVRELSDPERPAVLLYPGEGALDLTARAPGSAVTLVVVDGTWSQARKVVKQNAILQRLPRYAFEPASPSEYRIRKEPHEACVSTIEALAHALGALEGDPERFAALLNPFRAMVDAQLAFARARVGPGRHAKKRPRTGPRPPAILARRAEDLVCVTAEANAWPYPAPGDPAPPPEELVHWAACRPSTGERLERVVRPMHGVSPRTPVHIGLSRAEIASGCSAAELLEAWTRFTRPSDVMCVWGPFAQHMLESAGGTFGSAIVVDLRRVARDLTHGRAGTAEAFRDRLNDAPGAAAPLVAAAPLAAPLAAPFAAPLAAGRAGARLAQLVGIVRALAR